ncbi:MAG TPA: ribonuclease domain-containing protein [Nitrospiraceae bacterium]|nr:ribonuclease domain-containing protein [Nitrospiraceae bacterium]
MMCLNSRLFSPVFLGLALAVGSTGSLVAQINNPAATAAQHSDAFHVRTSDPASSVTSETSIPASTQAEEPPQKARDLLHAIQGRQGEPPMGYVGGRTFHNRERHLPKGRYREYDVNPKLRGRPRDEERIVIEQDTGKAYYTGDHYRTFIPLN